MKLLTATATLLLIATAVADAQAPGAPGLFVFSVASDEMWAVWGEPSDTGGSAITSYDLQYVATDEKDTADWTLLEGVGGNQIGTNPAEYEYLITGLELSTWYDVEVAAFTVDAECADGLCRARTGIAVRFTDTSTGQVNSRTWDFGNGRPGRLASVDYAWAEPGFSIQVTDTATGAMREYRNEPGLPAPAVTDVRAFAEGCRR